jgi:hypothetical protein
MSWRERRGEDSRYQYVQCSPEFYKALEEARLRLCARCKYYHRADKTCHPWGPVVGVVGISCPLTRSWEDCKKFKEKEPCPRCGGSGVDPFVTGKCHSCLGDGFKPFIFSENR